MCEKCPKRWWPSRSAVSVRSARRVTPWCTRRCGCSTPRGTSTPRFARSPTRSTSPSGRSSATSRTRKTSRCRSSGTRRTRSSASSPCGRRDEPPFTALANSFRASLRALTADEGPAEESAYLLVIKLIDTTPSLLAALLRYLHDRDEETVRILAEREGVDPETDRRPRLAVGVYTALVVAANREWRTGRRRERGGDARRVRGQRGAAEVRPGRALDLSESVGVDA